jgi:hypothetical protein
MGINSDISKYYNVVNNLFDEYISRGIRPSNIKKHFAPESRLNEFIERNNLEHIDVIKKVINDVIEDMVSIEKDENRSKRKNTLNEDVVLTFESFKVFESDEFKITSISQCLYKGIGGTDRTDSKVEKFLADHFDTNLSQINIIDSDKHLFKVNNWENDDLLVIVYNKYEMDIIKSNIKEYLIELLSKEKVDLIGLTIKLEDIVDKSKTESYIESKFDDEKITKIIFYILVDMGIKTKFEKVEEYYLWIEKQ